MARLSAVSVPCRASRERAFGAACTSDASRNWDGLQKQLLYDQYASHVMSNICSVVARHTARAKMSHCACVWPLMSTTRRCIPPSAYPACPAVCSELALLRVPSGAPAELASLAAMLCSTEPTAQTSSPIACIFASATQTLCHAQVTDMTTVQAAMRRAFIEETCGSRSSEGKARAGAKGNLRCCHSSHCAYLRSSTGQLPLRCRMLAPPKEPCQSELTHAAPGHLTEPHEMLSSLLERTLDPSWRPYWLHWPKLSVFLVQDF
jgi:hypothetical protein